MKKKNCDCDPHENQVCDICQGVTRPSKRKPIVLDFKPPTPEEVGRILGVPQKRVKELKALVHKSLKGTKPKAEKPVSRYGYHTIKIKKGVLGEISKIQEELDELKDAEAQGVKILIACELSDLYGALRLVAVKHGYKMSDLHDMSKLTRRAFEQGLR